jgi:hypothetical protein
VHDQTMYGQFLSYGRRVRRIRTLDAQRERRIFYVLFAVSSGRKVGARMKYIFSREIRAAEGVVLIEVEAPTEAEAMKLAGNDNSGRLIFDRVQITKLSDPVFIGLSVAPRIGNA